MSDYYSDEELDSMQAGEVFLDKHGYSWERVGPQLWMCKVGERAFYSAAPKIAKQYPRATIEDLEEMPVGAVFTDSETGDRLEKIDIGEWRCDGCRAGHPEQHLVGTPVTEVIYPEVPRPEPTEQPLSDDQAHHPAPTLGELLQALEVYRSLFQEDGMSVAHAERVRAIQEMIDERIGL